MPAVNLTSSLRAEYQQLFDTCQVSSGKAQEVEQLTLSLITNKPRYVEVADILHIPWQLIAVIHNMESSQSFHKHLHNGDPLTARTRQVPAGRPKTGNPPFTWKASAIDALSMHKLDSWQDWSLPGLLYCLESYNGWGYRQYHPSVKSPYLWSGSHHYTAGKYIADGTWSATAKSAQCGAATLLRRMAEKGEFLHTPATTNSTAPAILQATTARPLFAYAPNTVTAGGIELQKYLNSLPNIFLKEDGKLGEKTSNACMLAFGSYLQKDPRQT